MSTSHRGLVGKAKAGMAHSDCWRTCECAGKTAKSLVNTCHTWALNCGGDSLRRGAIYQVYAPFFPSARVSLLFLADQVIDVIKIPTETPSSAALYARGGKNAILDRYPCREEAGELPPHWIW